MKLSKTKTQNFEFLNKAIFFPEQEILAIGDLHLGYEYMLREAGINLPFEQIKNTINDIIKIINSIRLSGKKVSKIVFLGDIKHYFAFHKGERNLFLDLMQEIEKYIKRENIIVIKGNHEKMENLADKHFVDFYIQDGLAFIHGDEPVKEAFSKEIKTIIMGHLHPAITITDNQKIKSEKYKCFLVGSYKNKQVIILPSFLPLVEGTSINEFLSDSSCFIPKDILMSFRVYAIGENKNYDFGKLKKLIRKREY
ncbi:metallophosphoesterase [Candidatus Pacearchaeota archaeon]|nr:metallophosphoesterase [Candidatus Pacearchaeota archaeon]